LGSSKHPGGRRDLGARPRAGTRLRTHNMTRSFISFGSSPSLFPTHRRGAGDYCRCRCERRRTWGRDHVGGWRRCRHWDSNRPSSGDSNRRSGHRLLHWHGLRDRHGRGTHRQHRERAVDGRHRCRIEALDVAVSVEIAGTQAQRHSCQSLQAALATDFRRCACCVPCSHSGTSQQSFANAMRYGTVKQHSDAR
jgi:hypothetical protein